MNWIWDVMLARIGWMLGGIVEAFILIVGLPVLYVVVVTIADCRNRKSGHNHTSE